MNNTVAIIACLKCEERYIKEWLDWHIKIGVDHFYLCDNNDSDYPIKLYDIIKDYVENGIAEIFDYNDVHPIQPYCYNDIYQKYGDLYDWYLIIDIDEFLVIPKTNDNLKKFIETFPKHVDNMSFNWRHYGDNGLIVDDGRGCLERFTEPVNIEKNNYIIKNGKSNKTKSMIRNKQYFIDNYENFKPIIKHQHTLFLNYDTNNYNITHKKQLYKYDVLFNRLIYNTDYKLMYADEIFSQNSVLYNYILNKIYNTCYIKHFYSKTIDEYIKYKINRGDTLKLKNNKKYPYDLGRFFGKNTETDAHDEFLFKQYNIKRGKFAKKS